MQPNFTLPKTPIILRPLYYPLSHCGSNSTPHKLIFPCTQAPSPPHTKTFLSQPLRSNLCRLLQPKLPLLTAKGFPIKLLLASLFPWFLQAQAAYSLPLFSSPRHVSADAQCTTNKFHRSKLSCTTNSPTFDTLANGSLAAHVTNCTKLHLKPVLKMNSLPQDGTNPMKSMLLSPCFPLIEPQSRKALVQPQPVAPVNSSHSLFSCFSVTPYQHHKTKVQSHISAIRNQVGLLCSISPYSLTSLPWCQEPATKKQTSLWQSHSSSRHHHEDQTAIQQPSWRPEKLSRSPYIS